MNAYCHGKKIIEILEYRTYKHAWAIALMENGKTIPVRTDHIEIKK